MEPVVNAERWSRWTAVGPADAMSQVFDVVDANLPDGWRRLLGDDLRLYSSLVRSGSGWYALDGTSDHVGVVLSIERPRDAELRGGWTWFAGPPHPTGTPSVAAAWDQVDRFLREVIVPTAESVGATVRIPTAEDVFLSDLPGNVRDRLLNFAATTRKQLPLNREEAIAWREVVIAAFRAIIPVNSDSFHAWLVHTGWSADSANELVWRFFDHCLLLARYKDEVSAA